jgi:hypothetical protein
MEKTLGEMSSTRKTLLGIFCVSLLYLGFFGIKETTAPRFYEEFGLELTESKPENDISILQVILPQFRDRTPIFDDEKKDSVFKAYYINLAIIYVIFAFSLNSVSTQIKENNEHSIHFVSVMVFMLAISIGAREAFVLNEICREVGLDDAFLKKIMGAIVVIILMACTFMQFNDRNESNEHKLNENVLQIFLRFISLQFDPKKKEVFGDILRGFFSGVVLIVFGLFMGMGF